MKNTRYIVVYALLALCMISARLDAQDTINFNQPYRPQYHLTPVRGALFDPTALIYLDGKYMVNKGVALSSDLVNWKLGYPQRLNNDSAREMSGSAVIDSFNTSGFGINGQAPLVAVYSGLRIRDGRQFQCIAYSNDKGVSWIPYRLNPVIDIGSTEFRDPQVFWYAGTKKWIMVVALAAERKVRFYESSNLKEWNFLSDFGSYGAVNGVWECPDLFKLPVKGIPGVYKWVLEVSVQPISGQYFIGEFDGKIFTADSAFQQTSLVYMPEGKVLFDFENDLSGWKTEGDAFSLSPSKGPLNHQNAVLGYMGKQLVNSFFPGDKGTGKISSPTFIIDHDFLNFLVGGGQHENKTCINLIVDNKIVRTKTGTDAEVLSWTGWNVAELRGKTAQLEISDQETGGFGHIMVDQVMLSDHLAESKREKAFWLDYGPDFYAVRSWVNGPANDNRRISVAWLGSWLYATKVPTQPWKGGHTFPRAVELEEVGGQVRLVQNPVKEIELLRTKHVHLENLSTGNNDGQVTRLVPSKNSYEILGEFELADQTDMEIEVCANARQNTIIKYNTGQQEISVDRSRSGLTDFSPAFPGIYSAKLNLKNNRIKLHILVDESSIEVFANDGEVNITCQIFPDADAKGINLRVGKGKAKIINLDMWELGPYAKASGPLNKN